MWDLKVVNAGGELTKSINQKKKSDVSNENEIKMKIIQMTKLNENNLIKQCRSLRKSSTVCSYHVTYAF